MSTIDVVEETSIFTSFATTNSTSVIDTDQEITWLVILIGSVLWLIYTFLKRKS